MDIRSRFNQDSYTQVPDVYVGRSLFDRSYTVKDTFDFDKLIPFYVDEIIPGDSINLSLNSFGRLATQIVPILDNLYLDFYFFFVPNRLVWTHWENFMGAREPNKDSSIDYTIPVVNATVATTGVDTLFDKFGLPYAKDYDVNALPFRAYNLIYNDWFRSSEHQDSVAISLDDGPDAPNEYGILTSNKRPDYFTTLLTSPQKGDDVLLPVDIVTDGTQPTLTGGGLTNAGMLVEITTSKLSMSGVATGTGSVVFGNNTGLEVGPTSTITALREAMQIQSLLELYNRGGTRYVEILRSVYNVVSPDFRLQRPEFLGGGSTRINIHPVAQTSPTSGSNALGQLAAFGTVSASGQIGFSKSFVEHGYVMGIVRARADMTYQQNINRMWTRSTLYDFFIPKLQEIGDQAVLQKELFYNDDANDDLVMGYSERYAEYKFKPSEIHGEFRSAYTTPLDMWHMSEEMSAGQVFLDAFIESSTPITRSIAVAGAPHILFDAYLNIKHSRPMLTYSVPASLGRL